MGIMFEKAKSRFDKFISDNYDLSDDRIYGKVDHTYKVVKMTEYIADDLKLNDEDRELAMLISLLHDIGRFDQAKEFGSFREDINSADHAALGVKILFENGFIREFISDDRFDNIINQAIANHSCYKLDESGLTDRELLHCKLLRDADKTDSFRVKAISDIYSMANVTQEELENSLISDTIFDDFMSAKTILSKDRKTAADIWVSYIAFIFDFNFVSGLKYIKEKDYINILVDRFDFKNADTKEKFEIIRNFALDYLDKRIQLS